MKDRLLQPVKEALLDAEMSEENATDVVIVGGSTKIPFVKSMLESHFNTTLCEKVDKDTGIAQGAALYAAFMYSNLTEFSGPL